MIVQRRNYVEWMVDNMPEVVRRKTDIKCLLGDQFGSCESKTSQAAKLLCKTRTQQELEEEQKCHLERYSEYQYNVALAMSGPLFGTGRTVELVVGDELRHTVLAMKTGQPVRALGNLVSVVGSEEVQIDVRDISFDLLE
jgi:hypothetical protein